MRLEPWHIGFVDWLVDHSVRVIQSSGKMMVVADEATMSQDDRHLLKEYETMVLARNN